jgi:transketolase
MKDNIDIEPLKQKLEAFRWNVMEMDGHDVEDIDKVLRQSKERSLEGPAAIIVHTVKGRKDCCRSKKIVERKILGWLNIRSKIKFKRDQK